MFEDALFATNRRRTPQQRWAAVLSFLLQAAFVTVLVGLPLYFTDALPLNYVQSIVAMPTLPSGRSPEPEQPRVRPRQTTSNQDQQGHVIAITRIPIRVTQVVETAPPPPIGDDVGVAGVPRGSGSSGLMRELFRDVGRGIEISRPPDAPRTIRLSHIEEGLLIHKVTPDYPSIARAARQQGTVLLHAIIGKDGTIQQLQVVSGPPLLIRPAMEAVKQWRYKPYVLNGQPVEVDTQITVNFRLGS